MCARTMRPRALSLLCSTAYEGAPSAWGLPRAEHTAKHCATTRGVLEAVPAKIYQGEFYWKTSAAVSGGGAGTAAGGGGSKRPRLE